MLKDNDVWWIRMMYHILDSIEGTAVVRAGRLGSKMLGECVREMVSRRVEVSNSSPSLGGAEPFHDCPVPNYSKQLEVVDGIGGPLHAEPGDVWAA